MALEQDQEFVEYVLKTVVDNPDDVKVDRTVDEMGVLITVSVNPDDMGKVIGKSGQTAKAIRTLLKVVGAKHDARVNMKIVEPDGGQGAPAQSQSDETPAGPTAAADDVPADETSETEAAAEQQQTEAAAPQPSENDSAVDEATGQPVGDEPKPANGSDDLAPEREPSPLDEL